MEKEKKPTRNRSAKENWKNPLEEGNVGSIGRR